MSNNGLILKKATEARKQVKLRIGISGASGFGKTYSALRVANGICNDWDKIAVIDTENESAALYCEKLGDYKVLCLQPPFTPERYIQAIKVCEDAGMEVIIIDSISHEWEGEGGVLEIHKEQAEKEAGKNSYTAWAKVTPRHNKFIQKILQSKCHVITTSRRKQDYELIKDENTGKSKPQKVGTKEITREGYEYELTINFEIYLENHIAKASKDRSGLFDGQEFLLTEEVGKMLIDWANKGQNPIEVAINELNLATNHNELASVWKNINDSYKTAEVLAVYNRKFEDMRTPMSNETLITMKSFIEQGKVEVVKKSLPRYILTESQLQSINEAIAAQQRAVIV
jgi:hypothetical protein